MDDGWIDGCGWGRAGARWCLVNFPPRRGCEFNFSNVSRQDEDSTSIFQKFPAKRRGFEFNFSKLLSRQRRGFEFNFSKLSRHKIIATWKKHAGGVGEYVKVRVEYCVCGKWEEVGR